MKLDLAYLPIKELNSVKSVSKNKKEESGERYTYIHMKKNRTGIVCISDTKLIGHAERIFCFAVRISCEKGGKKGGCKLYEQVYIRITNQMNFFFLCYQLVLVFLKFLAFQAVCRVCELVGRSFKRYFCCG